MMSVSISSYIGGCGMILDGDDMYLWWQRDIIEREVVQHDINWAMYVAITLPTRSELSSGIEDLDQKDY
jgi:hypothetical protein